jgi:hypothetical protein
MSFPIIDEALVDSRTPGFQNGCNDTHIWLPTKLAKHPRVHKRLFENFRLESTRAVSVRNIRSTRLLRLLARIDQVSTERA